jgi:WD40 repeat protein
MIRKIVISLCLILILSGCGPEMAQVPPDTNTAKIISSQTPYPSPTNTPAPLPESNYPMALEVISPENVDRLEQIDRWGEGNIHSVAVSPDEKTIAVYTVSGIHLYDSMTLEETRFIDTGISNKYSNLPIAFSPDGQLLAYSDGQIISLWDLTINEQRDWFFSAVPDWQVINIDFNPDGNRVLVEVYGFYKGYDGSNVNFALYDLDGHLLFDQYGFADYYRNTFRFTADGRLFLFFNSVWNIQTTLRIYIVDQSNGQLLTSEWFTTDSDQESSYYDISPNGKYIASFIYDGGKGITTIKESKTGEAIQSVEGLILFVNSSDGKPAWERSPYIVYFDDKEETVSETCGIVNESGHTDYQELFSSENKAVIFNTKIFLSESLALWNFSTCEIEKEILFPSAQQLVFSRDGKFLAVSSTNSIYLWDVKSKKIGLTISDAQFSFLPGSFVFNSDETRLITQGRNIDDNPCSFLVWDTQTGNLLRTLTPFVCSDYQFFPSPVSNFIAMYQRNKMELQFWDIENGEFLYTAPIESPTFEASGNFWGIIREEDQLDKLVLYDIQTGSELKIINTSYQGLNIIFSSEDDSPLVTDFFDPDEGKKYLVIFETKTGEQISKIIIEDRIKQSFTWFLRDRFVIDTHDGYLNFCQYGQEKPYLTIQGDIQLRAVNDSFTGYTSSYYHDMYFSPHEKVAITYNEKSNLARFWDTQTGQLLGEITPDYEIEDIAFSPDGRIIAVSGEDGLIRIWGVLEE